MAANWSEKSITVVFFPSDALHKELTPLIAEWTAEGLLGSFLAITPSFIKKVADEPLSIEAELYGLNDEGEYQPYRVDAYDQLAQNEYSIVRMVGIHMLRKGYKVDSKATKLQGEALKYLTQALPLAASGSIEGQGGTRILRINLVTSTSELKAEEFDTVFDDIWSMHVIASPEDRSTPWTGDALVKDDEKYKLFALMHLATTGGLWNGLAASPYELVDNESAKGGNFWLSRVFVNAILTDGISRRVAAKVVDGVANASTDIYDSNLGVVVPGTQLIPNEDSDRWIDWMVSQVFTIEDGVLSFNAPYEQEVPERQNWYEWTQIRSFLIFSWDKLKVIPWWMWMFIRRRIGKGLTDTFQGSDGLAEVGISQTEPMDSRDKILARSIVEVAETQARARMSLNAQSLSNAVKTSPSLWSSIRRLVFGMLDGSDLQEFGVEPHENRVPVFTRTGQIISNPADTFTVPKSMEKALGVKEIQWSALEKADLLENKFAEEIAATQAQIQTIEGKLNSAQGGSF